MTREELREALAASINSYLGQELRTWMPRWAEMSKNPDSPSVILTRRAADRCIAMLEKLEVWKDANN